MNVSSILSLAPELAGTTTNDFPATKLLPFLNLVKDDFFSYLITGAGEDRKWDIWKTTSVDNQTEYVLPEAASDSEGNLKLNGVSVNYDGNTYGDGTLKYTKATLVTPSALSHHWNQYVNNQSKENPIYFIADQSIFIAPTPKSGQGRDNRIELKGIKSLVDYTDSTTEADTGIPPHLHGTLIQGLLPYIHRMQGRKDEASFEAKQYIIDRELAVLKFSNRVQTSSYMDFPSDINTTDSTFIFE